MVECSGRGMRRDRITRGPGGPRGVHGRRRATSRTGDDATDLWRDPPSYGRREAGPPGVRARGRTAACHHRRVMDGTPAGPAAPGRRRLPRRRRRDPPAAGRPSRPAPTAVVGRRGPGLPAEHGPTSATPTSSGARRGCARPMRTCWATSPAGGCSRSAAAPRLLPLAAGGGRGAGGLDVSGGMLPGAPSNRATGLPVALCRPTRGRCRSPTPRRPGLLGVRRAAVRRRRRRRAGRGGAGAAARRPVRGVGEPPDALADARLPDPEDLRVPRPPTSTAGRTWRPTTPAGGLRRAPPHDRRLGARRRRRRASCLSDLVEPEWTPGRTQTWGQWSPERGALVPGTLVLVCDLPAARREDVMDLQLTGRRAVVTGAGRGIGRAVALGLAREGARVALVHRDRDALEQTAEAVRELGGRRWCSRPTPGTTTRCGRWSRRSSALGWGEGRADVNVLAALAARPASSVPVPRAGRPGRRRPAGRAGDEGARLPALRPGGGAAHGRRRLGPDHQRQRAERPLSGSLVGSVRNVAVAAMTKNLADELGPAGITVTVVHPGTTVTEALPQRLADRAPGRARRSPS